MLVSILDEPVFHQAPKRLGIKQRKAERCKAGVPWIDARKARNGEINRTGGESGREPSIHEEAGEAAVIEFPQCRVASNKLGQVPGELGIPRRESSSKKVGERLLVLSEQIVEPGLLAVIRLKRRVLVLADDVQVLKSSRLPWVQSKVVDKHATLLDAVWPWAHPLHRNGAAVLGLENNTAARLAGELVVHLRQGPNPHVRTAAAALARFSARNFAGPLLSASILWNRERLPALNADLLGDEEARGTPWQP